MTPAIQDIGARRGPVLRRGERDDRPTAVPSRSPGATGARSRPSARADRACVRRPRRRLRRTPRTRPAAGPRSTSTSSSIHTESRSPPGPTPAWRSTSRPPRSTGRSSAWAGRPSRPATEGRARPAPGPMVVDDGPIVAARRRRSALRAAALAGVRAGRTVLTRPPRKVARRFAGEPTSAQGGELDAHVRRASRRPRRR
jgi:hypothetical protein